MQVLNSAKNSLYHGKHEEEIKRTVYRFDIQKYQRTGLMRLNLD